MRRRLPPGAADGTSSDGDAALADRLRALLGPQHPVAAVAVLTRAGTTLASLGATLEEDFEIGSLSKGVTGLLYADALERGEVHPATTLGDLLPLGRVPAADVRLASIATHRSGLPRLPASAAPLRRTLALWVRGANPYGESLAELLDQARGLPVGQPRPLYSNLGFQLLGHALAAASGVGYADLVRDRITVPLGMSGTYAPETPARLRPTALQGRSRTGRQRAPWTGEALAPAGGLRAPITDLARLAEALLDGTAPGLAALDPVEEFTGPAVRIGAAWIIVEPRGREITWHNGGTGGFCTWLGLDREAGTGVALVSATARSVDRHGFDLLTEIS